LLRLPEELARVDALLDDLAFFAPFAPYFHPVLGRPSTPVECCLRLMFLKFRYRLGFESLAGTSGRPVVVCDLWGAGLVQVARALILTRLWARTP
jgi:hypothetical protein